MAKGDAAANIAYCSKEDPTPFRFGEPAAPGHVNGGAANRRRWEDAFELARNGEFDQIDPDIHLRYFRTLREIRSEEEWKQAATSTNKPDIVLRPWQSDVVSILRHPIHDRTIHFVYDPIGNAGKTTFCRYLTTNDEFKDKCQLLHPSRGVDMAYLLRPREIYLLDFPRASKEHIPWATIESIKNGHVTSTKYECVEKIFKIPHVIVFCNNLPEDGTLSEDRINIIQI